MILQALIHFANDGEMKIPSGPVYEGENAPVAVFRIPYGYASAWQHSHEIAREVLTAICKQGIENGMAYVNKTHLRTLVWAEDDNLPCVGVPSIEEPEEFTAMALYLAFTTPTGSGDSWAHRIRQCDYCHLFFLQKTRKPSRFCRGKCRWDWFNISKSDKKNPPRGELGGP